MESCQTKNSIKLKFIIKYNQTRCPLNSNKTQLLKQCKNEFNIKNISLKNIEKYHRLNSVLF